MPEKEGGGNGEEWLAGLELAERLPRKMPEGGTMSSSSGGVWGFWGWGDDFTLSEGITAFFSIFIVASVQLLGDDRICVRPLENSSGGICATSASDVFWAWGTAQLFLPTSVIGRAMDWEPKLPLCLGDGGAAFLILFSCISASLWAVM